MEKFLEIWIEDKYKNDKEFVNKIEKIKNQMINQKDVSKDELIFLLECKTAIDSKIFMSDIMYIIFLHYLNINSEENIINVTSNNLDDVYVNIVKLNNEYYRVHYIIDQEDCSVCYLAYTGKVTKKKSIIEKITFV